MSAKRPMYEPRICWVDGDKGRTLWNGRHVGTGGGLVTPRRVRVVDAREPTAEKAVERVLQVVCQVQGDTTFLDLLAGECGMTATVKNGKVTVRRGKR